MNQNTQRPEKEVSATAKAQNQSCSANRILGLYLSLPDTPNRSSRTDRKLASQLTDQGVPLPTICSALLLASARRLCRDPQSPPLPLIRSLHYFLPVIEELQDNPLPPSYLDYLQSKILTPPQPSTGALHKNRTS